MKFFLAFLLLIAAIVFVMFIVAAFEHIRKADLSYLKPKINRIKFLSRIFKKESG
jgi:hypothetical protein